MCTNCIISGKLAVLLLFEWIILKNILGPGICKEIHFYSMQVV